MSNAEPLGYWVIPGEDLLDMLRQVQAGADPDLVLAENYANADHEYPPPADPVSEEIAELMAKPELTEPESIRLHLLLQPTPHPPWWMPRWLRRLIRKNRR